MQKHRATTPPSLPALCWTLVLNVPRVFFSMVKHVTPQKVDHWNEAVNVWRGNKGQLSGCRPNYCCTCAADQDDKDKDKAARVGVTMWLLDCWTSCKPCVDWSPKSRCWITESWLSRWFSPEGSGFLGLVYLRSVSGLKRGILVCKITQESN